jgi:hypothetical protein
VVNAGELKVLEVVGVMHDALGVGFVVANFEREFVIAGHGGVGGGGGRNGEGGTGSSSFVIPDQRLSFCPRRFGKLGVWLALK